MLLFYQFFPFICQIYFIMAINGKCDVYLSITVLTEGIFFLFCVIEINDIVTWKIVL